MIVIVAVVVDEIAPIKISPLDSNLTMVTFHPMSNLKEGEVNMKCKTSHLYGKDNAKQLHFYCEFCGKEMEHNEDRVCELTRKD